MEGKRKVEEVKMNSEHFIKLKGNQVDEKIATDTCWAAEIE